MASWSSHHHTIVPLFSLVMGLNKTKPTTAFYRILKNWKQRFFIIWKLSGMIFLTLKNISQWLGRQEFIFNDDTNTCWKWQEMLTKARAISGFCWFAWLQLQTATSHQTQGKLGPGCSCRRLIGFPIGFHNHGPSLGWKRPSLMICVHPNFTSTYRELTPI